MINMGTDGEPSIYVLYSQVLSTTSIWEHIYIERETKRAKGSRSTKKQIS